MPLSTVLIHGFDVFFGASLPLLVAAASAQGQRHRLGVPPAAGGGAAAEPPRAGPGAAGEGVTMSERITG